MTINHQKAFALGYFKLLGPRAPNIGLLTPELIAFRRIDILLRSHPVAPSEESSTQARRTFARALAR
ncbi:hypothetical protein [Bradyrhizobium canariense]|uniref:hypothetical protein n=1 Tax=Bradyrhizobium canariense TaxID=255045 RepID=UPI00117811F6|nr:hypothetical protein [Bradyrhizobium canariense]